MIRKHNFRIHGHWQGYRDFVDRFSNNNPGKLFNDDFGRFLPLNGVNLQYV